MELNTTPERFDFPAEQIEYMRLVLEKAKLLYGDKPKACVVTYGCQQNFSDSERIKGMLIKMGYSLITSPEDADFLLYNTCAVRGHAEDRVFGNVGAVKHYKRRRPGMIVAVCGCMAQQEIVEERVKRSYPYVDILFGTNVEYRLPEFLYKRLNGSPRIFERDDRVPAVVENVPVHRDGNIKGWLPIMYGCNNFCTYCIVPYVRGRERSRNPEDVIAEAREMVKLGYKDITLLGQNVNSYGKGEEHGVDFATLLRRINDIDGDFRIRFMTSHPKDCTRELLEAMSECEKVCKHLHLPFQSGSDRILKLMNRHYDRASYLELIKTARSLMPDISLTSDVIVGFPGETYEDFKQTLSLIDEVEFSSLFTFIYSARHGTPAAEMPDPISEAEKGVWFRELLSEQEQFTEKFNRSHIGNTYRVLCDDFGRKEGLLTGRTDSNTVVEFEGDASLLGNFANAKVDGISSVLTGKLI